MFWVNTMVRTNIKSHGLVPAYFALIIIIVVHVVKHQSVLINVRKALKCKPSAQFDRNVACIRLYQTTSKVRGISIEPGSSTGYIDACIYIVRD